MAAGAGGAPPFKVVKVRLGREREVADELARRSGGAGPPVLSIVAPSGLKGYIVVETADRDLLAARLKGMASVKGLLEWGCSLADLRPLLSPAWPECRAIEPGDEVTAISGALAGERLVVTGVHGEPGEVRLEARPAGGGGEGILFGTFRTPGGRARLLLLLWVVSLAVMGLGYAIIFWMYLRGG